MNSLKPLLAAIPATAALALAAAPAGAATYCVHHPATPCPAGQVDKGTDVAGALAAADAAADQDYVRLQPGTYHLGAPYKVKQKFTQIHGTPGSTFVSGMAAATLLDVGPGMLDGVNVQNTTSGGTALRVAGGRISNTRVSITAPNVTGVRVAGGWLQDSEIITHGNGSTGVVAEPGVPGGSHLQALSVDGTIALRTLPGSDVEIGYTRLKGGSVGSWIDGGTVEASNTAFLGDAIAVRVDCDGGPTLFDARFTSIKASGTALTSNCYDTSATVKLRNSVAAGSVAFSRATASPTTFDVDWTAYAGTIDKGASAATFTVGNGSFAVADPKFAGADDLHLQAGSPLIDRAQDLGPASDLEYSDRPTDGDGDGDAGFDLGAYEAPKVAAVPAPNPPAGGGGGGGVPAGGGGGAAAAPAPAAPAPAPAVEPAPAEAPVVEAPSTTPVAAPVALDLRGELRRTLRAGKLRRHSAAFTHRFLVPGTLKVRIVRGGEVVARGTLTRTTAGTAKLRIRGIERRGLRVRGTFAPATGAKVRATVRAARR